MNLQERRAGIGITQSEVARAAGISRTALSLIETGRLHPSRETLQAIETALDPFSSPVRLVCPGGPLAAADLLSEIARKGDLAFALTLDVAAWFLTEYQSPAACWAYVRPMGEWTSALAARGTGHARSGERANLVLLRATGEALADSFVADGHALVGPRRLVADCARLGGRHSLDAARIYLELPESRTPGLRLDADSLLKVFEEVMMRT